MTHNATDDRYTLLLSWLQTIHQERTVTLVPLLGDAGFRRYYRYTHQQSTFIAVDAPPSSENNAAFVVIAKTLQQAGLYVPEVFHYDLNNGFMVLADLGDKQLLRELNAQTVSPLYQQAIDELLKIQRCRDTEHYRLPFFDSVLIQKECQLFKEWFLEKHLGSSLNTQQSRTFEHMVEHFIINSKQQPQVWVHRDYHSRNLMLCENKKLGILDFQDAVWGPISYDFISLVRDCYIDWPEEQVAGWTASYYQLLRVEKQLTDISLSQFTEWVDTTGAQRHLKAIGIFARKFQRDHTKAYLGDIPRTLRYVQHISEQHKALRPLYDFLGEVLSKTANAIEVL